MRDASKRCQTSLDVSVAVVSLRDGIVVLLRKCSLFSSFSNCSSWMMHFVLSELKSVKSGRVGVVLSIDTKTVHTQPSIFDCKLLVKYQILHSGQHRIGQIGGHIPELCKSLIALEPTELEREIGSCGAIRNGRGEKGVDATEGVAATHRYGSAGTGKSA